MSRRWRMVGGGVLMRGGEGVVLHHRGTVKGVVSKLCSACRCSLLLYYLHGLTALRPGCWCAPPLEAAVASDHMYANTYTIMKVIR